MGRYTVLAALRQEINDKIETDDMDGAFGSLKSMKEEIQASNHKNTITILLNRYNHFRDEEIKGGMKEEEIERRRIVLFSDLQDFLNRLEFQITLNENHSKIAKVEKSLAQITARLSLNVEIAKERISKMGECWESMYIFESHLFGVVRDFLGCLLKENELEEELAFKFRQFQAQRNLDNLYSLLSHEQMMAILENCNLTMEKHEELLGKIHKIFKKYYTKADLILEKNKFWLGPKIYEEARKYHDCYPMFFTEYKEKKYTGSLTCLSYQKAAKVSIENAIKEFQDKFF